MRKFILILCILISTTANTQYALNFDGTNDYVDLPDFTVGGNITIEAWINVTAHSNYSRIIELASSGFERNENITFGFQSTNGKLFYETWGAGNPGSSGGFVITDNAIVTGQWVHVAVTHSGTSVTLYVNGVAVKTGTVTASVTVSRNDNYIAKSHFAADAYFNGKIDELRIWSTIRTAAEIKNSMFGENLTASQSGLVAHYKFNDGSGTTATNSCNNTAGIDGTLTNGPTWVSSPVVFASNALNFDATNDYIEIPYNAALNPSSFTIEAWVNVTSNGNYKAVVSSRNSGLTYGYIVYIIPTVNKVLLLTGTGTGIWDALESPAALPSGWNHIACTYDGTTKKIYINGVLEASASGSYTANTVRPTRIGAGFNESTTPNYYFNGSIDEVRIWNVARTVSEISTNMNVEILPSTTGLVSYYTFNQGITSGTNSGLINVVDKTSDNNGTLTNIALTGATSNFVAGKTDLFVLPITWLSFTAQKQNNQVALNWSTASEQNSKDFLVQHSNNATVWNTIGNVLAAGNSNSIKNYSYTHSIPEKGKNYYRLLQRDNDGKNSFSQIRMLNFETKQKSVTLLENPVTNGQMRLLVNTATMVSFYNNEGKLLWKKQMAIGTQNINVNGYAKGIYLLKTEIETQQIVIE